MGTRSDAGMFGHAHAGNRARLRELRLAALTDSFGLAFGWTVLNLLAVARGGLAAVGLYNAAMLAGIFVSAPATTWLAGRLHGRTLLRTAAGVEVVLRPGILVAVLAGWPAPVVAAAVLVLHVAAWIGYAGMRAEVAAVDHRAAAMTSYVMCVAAVEAAGTGLAALLPIGAGGRIGPLVTAGVATLYAVSLVPTILTATRARVSDGDQARVRPATREALRSRRPSDLARSRLPVGALIGGGAVMLLGSGPTLLAVGLATELHGQASVVGAAAAFGAGSLLASAIVGLVARRRISAALTWPLWGMGMLIGWIAAPEHLVGLLVAQFLAGLSLTAFEGETDARIVGHARPGQLTGALAWSAATRALGSAVAVRILPVLVAAPAIGRLSMIAIGLLALGGPLAMATTRALQAFRDSTLLRSEPTATSFSS